MSDLTPAPVILMVDDDLSGQRLDRALGQLCDRGAAHLGLSRSRLQKLIADGQVRHVGEPHKALSPRTPVASGEHYEIILPPPVDADPEPEDIPLDIVYEDDSLIIVNKPAGMVVHPAPGAARGTLVNALLHHAAGSLSGIGGVLRPGIVHRIDKDTSGLLVVAKNDTAHHGLAKQFADHSIHRVYDAFVRGWPQPAEGSVTGALGRHPVDRKRMTIRQDGKWAKTHYKTREFYGVGEVAIAAWIECQLETGRTHQVRVHMAHIGHSLIADPVYGKPLSLRAIKADARGAVLQAEKALGRQALHARELGFHHPVTGETLQFRRDFPLDMSNLHQALLTYRISV